MTYRFVDLSDYQSGLDVDTVASCVDGAWCKVGDWGWISRYGWPGDNLHDVVIPRFLALGKPVGSYLFVRPGQTDPATQIDGWRAHCQHDCSVAPMIDLEVPGSLSGGSLTAWVDEALARTAEVFGRTPILYWSNTFARSYGMTAPSTPHVPFFAEYHYGYQTQLWQNVNSWEAHAYSAYGGPDVAPGYGPAVTPTSAIWQWTSSAQIPGFLGLVDCDWVPPAAYQLITDAGLPPASDTWEAFFVANQDTMNALAEFLRVFSTPGSLYYLGDVWNRTLASYNATDVARYGYTRLDGSPVDTIALWTLNLHERMTAQSLNPIAATAQETLDAVGKLQAGGGQVDVDKLAAALEAALDGKIAANVDPAEIARAVLDAVRAWLTTGGTPTGPVVLSALPDGPLPDPDAAKRSATALAGMETLVSELERGVYDPDNGVAARVERDVAKMGRTADGATPTPADIRAAIESAMADTTNRAAWLAANPPPAPVVPPAGDMGGTPT